MPGGRKTRDPMCKRLDEGTERVLSQGSIDPTVAFSHLRVVVLRAQYDFERPGPTHKAREVLGGSSARKLTECRLNLTENRRLARGKAHVTREHELAARAACATLDLCNGEETACAQVAKQHGNWPLACQLCRLLPILLDSRYV